MPVLKNYLANLPHTHLPWAETDAGKREVWGHGSDQKTEPTDRPVCDRIERSFGPQTRGVKQINAAGKIKRVGQKNGAIANFRANEKVYNKINVAKVNRSEHLKSPKDVRAECYFNLPPPQPPQKM